jgi:hypothetical protein
MKYRVTSFSVYSNPDNHHNHNMVSGICSFCNQSSGFKTNGCRSEDTVPLKCDNCGKNVVWDYSRSTILPVARMDSLRELPESIDHYYQEALSCIAALAPNGAATLFRKLIHQVGIHYNVATINDGKPLMGVVGELEKGGHINTKLVESLRRVKDLGNDGAHVNENEPDMEQIQIVKTLVDSFLQATVLQDANIKNYDQSKNK